MTVIVCGVSSSAEVLFGLSTSGGPASRRPLTTTSSRSAARSCVSTRGPGVCAARAAGAEAMNPTQDSARKVGPVDDMMQSPL
ncbi:hypothetical protein AB5I41_20220 [Sphingomonas sp. MMS24-JH45]